MQKGSGTEFRSVRVTGAIEILEKFMESKRREREEKNYGKRNNRPAGKAGI